MKRLLQRNWVIAGYLALSSVTVPAWASDFSLPFINAANLGDLYSGWAASAEDASTAFSNPAGLVRLGQRQFVVAGLYLFGNTKFTGSTMPPFPPDPPESGAAYSKLEGYLPSMYYAAPITENVVFALGITTPFALGTDYRTDSIVRHAATKSKIVVIDVGPSVGVKLTDKLSAGLGLDIERAGFTFNNIVGIPNVLPDFESQNHLKGWGYGWHGGLLYQFTNRTRVGVNYASQVVFHTTGNSKALGALGPGSVQYSDMQKFDTTMPALAQASLHHDFNEQWSVMGSVFYTDWSVFKQATLQHVLMPDGSTISVTIPFNYHNTFDYSVGMAYKPTRQWALRAGLEYMNTPTNDKDRIVNDPVGNATIVGVGAHYQQNATVGYDLAYAHSFFRTMPINHSSALAAEMGKMETGTNVVGFQITWNIS